MQRLMSSILPIGIETLLSGAVEDIRLEFKASWNEEKTGPQVLATIAAFANDLQNLNGGYLIIGVEESEGVAVRPVKGLQSTVIDRAQKWIRGNCRRISPEYVPLLSPETLDGQTVLVIWAPASDARPHEAPHPRDKTRRGYFVRDGSETVEAKGERRRRLIEQTSRIPFDDRVHLTASIEDLREATVREFLHDVRSDLVHERDATRIYESMRLTKPVNGHQGPRNFALLMFTDDPTRWFGGAQIELARFRDESGGDVIEERVFRGPLHHQIRQCYAHLQNLTTRHIEKVADHETTRGWVSYPIAAVREALVNAVYHRGYDGVLEPTKVYLYPDRMEIISYPGPVHGIKSEHFRPGGRVPKVPARNRRIGEHLKELRLAEACGTGIAKIYRTMQENGSPDPQFEFDEARSYFSVSLPAHPEYAALIAIGEYAYRSALGDAEGALRGLTAAFQATPESAVIGARLIQIHGERDDLAAAEAVAESFADHGGANSGRMALALASVYADHDRGKDARRVLDSARLTDATALVDAAILEKRLGRNKKAHRYFDKAGEHVMTDVRALHEYAQVKLKLAEVPRAQRHVRARQEARRRILSEAVRLLERVLQMDAPPTRHAWAWFNLSQALKWQRAPVSEEVAALKRALEILPDNERFQQALTRAQARA